MALDFLALEDDSLLATYEAKPYNPDKMRERFIKGIETSFKRLEGTATPQSAKWYTEKNGVVLFKPMLDSRPVEIKGKTERTIAADKFPEYLKLLKEAVEAGHLDDDLKAHNEISTKTGAKAAREPVSDLTKHRRSAGRLKFNGKSEKDIRAALEKRKANASDIETIMNDLAAAEKKAKEDAAKAN